MAEAAEHYEFHGRRNNRSSAEVSHDGHISIDNLKIALQNDTYVQQIRQDLGRSYELKILDNYLIRDIPNYPTPVQFHTSEVSHVTDTVGLDRIWESEGFMAHGDKDEKFLWWSLKIDEDTIEGAEELYLEEKFPDRSQNQRSKQETFLSKFTTSPAFSITESRYGNFRFTFPLNELMEEYKKQICEGQEPVLREYKTIFYKQEIMYVVLVHSPEVNEKFEKFSIIQKNSIRNSKFVYFKDNEIVWRAQAIGDKIKYELILDEAEKIAEVNWATGRSRYYVWDHVCLAFHFDGVFKFPKETLKAKCTTCNVAERHVTKNPISLEEAQKKLQDLIDKP